MFPIDAAQLAGILCETFFYGIYLVTCGFCAQTLLLMGSSNQSERRVRWMMASFAITFFLVSTWDVSIGILHLFRAFIAAEDPLVEFNKVADWINIARALNQSFTVLLSDFILIYRCWIVYGRRWLIVTPSIVLYLGAIAMTIKVTEIEVNPHAVQPVTMAICPWNTTMFGVNAAQNVLTTSMLVWRIWRTGKEVDRCINYPEDSGLNAYRPRYIQKSMRAIVESGLIYTTTVFVTFLVSATGSNAIYIPADMSLQTAGIVFNLIIVRSIGRNNQKPHIGIAGPGSGRITPMFPPTVIDASGDLEQNQARKFKQ
ncbi:hypothetical protein AGABI1DRAFT_130477 [Agaricus bisporus var. burnettii JB137-S8]|uniref:Uncharacterized protein n=1 Tax=Agaricus bisporus var. burnettii (strain JB137-S8 / ATCC MYA-4627 / FGSC 10392) TaxID=597362 RepID=K5XRA5_AGABU|nr:uncharacterized protein AGABI1DRAFT_130477 [Agaricus bisporus var. burnettii JB137-S8]EKM77395.1 hypothetical protein AGABI1DRAFT_130477 [Agaricus bisporus var. burnettii JB137-S8]